MTGNGGDFDSGAADFGAQPEDRLEGGAAEIAAASSSSLLVVSPPPPTSQSAASPLAAAASAQGRQSDSVGRKSAAVSDDGRGGAPGRGPSGPPLVTALVI